MNHQNTITRNSSVLSPYLYIRKVHPESVYDFTFEDRYVVYHHSYVSHRHREYVYSVLDTNTHRIFQMFTQPSCISANNYTSIIPALLFLVKNHRQRRHST